MDFTTDLHFLEARAIARVADLEKVLADAKAELAHIRGLMERAKAGAEVDQGAGAAGGEAAAPVAVKKRVVRAPRTPKVDDGAPPKETFTITFSESVEHDYVSETYSPDGLAKRGMTGVEVIAAARQIAIGREQSVEIYKLADALSPEMKLVAGDKARIDDAVVVVIRGGLKMLIGDDTTDGLADELKTFEFAKFMKIRGRVVRKVARHTAVVGKADVPETFGCDEHGAETGEHGMVNMDRLEILKLARDRLEEAVNKAGWKEKSLFAEVNHYYDVKNCGIGLHTDSERMLVIGGRVGASMGIGFSWFSKDMAMIPNETGANGMEVGSRFALLTKLHDGDLYFMTDVSSGKSGVKAMTAKHAAGNSPKYFVPSKWTMKDNGDDIRQVREEITKAFA